MVYLNYANAWGTSSEAILIEIKTPTTRLVMKTQYRKSVHAPSSDLSGRVVQIADYRDRLTRS